MDCDRTRLDFSINLTDTQAETIITTVFTFGTFRKYFYFKSYHELILGHFVILSFFVMLYFAKAKRDYCLIFNQYFHI